MELFRFAVTPAVQLSAMLAAMTTPPPQFARLGEFPVTVNHGTRRSLADDFVKVGQDT